MPEARPSRRPFARRHRRGAAVSALLLAVSLAHAAGSSAVAAAGTGAVGGAGPQRQDAASAPAASASAAEHVLLVSIDGFRPDFYRQPGWPAPTVQQLAAEGVSADRVRGVFPSVTYPSHTTILTGALPARHGIYYNSPFEPGGQTGRWYWQESLIRVPTLWDAVRAAGGSTANFGWPVSVGAPIDFNVPEVWSLQAGFGTVRPIREATTPEGLFEELEREATGRLQDADMSVDWLVREANVAHMAAWVIETRRPTLTTVHLIGVDHFEHRDGRDSPMVRRALAAADTAVGEMIDAYRRAGLLERTAVIVTGDHGFIDVHTTLAPNVWLAQAGLMEATRDRGDWRATFHTSAASAFLMLRDPNDTATLQRVREILDAQPAAVRRLFRVLDRGQLEALGASPEAALALAPAPGVSLTASARGPVLRSASGGTHGFYPALPQIATGLVAWGAGVRSGGVRVPQMTLADIAPLVARLLGLEFDAPDGVLLPGLLAERRSTRR